MIEILGLFQQKLIILAETHTLTYLELYLQNQNNQFSSQYQLLIIIIMGSCLQVCLGWTLLGCFNCCLKQLGICCGGLIGRQRLAKLFYVLLDVLVVVPAVFLFYYIQEWQWFVTYFSKWIHCPQQSGGYLNCFGLSAVYRLSMALLMLYVLLLMIMLCRNRFSKVVNEGLFIIKYCLVVGAFIGLLFVQNQIFQGYAQACRIIGIFFLIIQSIILIDLFYLWGISWITKYSEGKGIYGILLIAFSVIFMAGAITLNVLSYVYFYKCIYWPSIITSLLIIVIPLTQLFNFNPQNSLLTTSLLCLFISYLCFISLYSSPSCNMLNEGAMGADIGTSCLLFFITMFGSVMGGSGVVKVSQNVSLNQTLGVVTEESPSQQHEAPKKQLILQQQQQRTAIVLTDDYQSWDWVKWHIYMCIGSMYIANMITNWGTPKIDSPILSAYQPNQFSFWSKLALQWVTSLLYIWTLVAPRVFPERDFVIV